MNAADLEIGLFKHDEGDYRAELRYTYPESAVDIRLRSSSVLTFDFDSLRALQLDSHAYGRRLSDYLFADEEFRMAFIQARNNAQSHDIKVRTRLFIGPSASELHDLRWEILKAPDEDKFLFSHDQLYFSRYLSSYDWRPVRLRAREDLRGLIVIVSPGNLDQYQQHGSPLHKVNTEQELIRATTALADIETTFIAGDRPATLDNIFDALADGYDFLYLVCHGSLQQGIPYLWLEDANGNVKHIHGSDFLDRLRDLRDGPRLVVLASCQSGGHGEQSESRDEGALAALGPRLAATGTPAVVAMQGNISAETLSRYMPVLFKELQKDGQIDRAMAIARRAVQDRPDWWIPVLFMRLKSGRIWYSTGFSATTMKRWPALLANIREGKCTPIIGPGLTEPLLGSRREIARSWAQTYHFPMAPHLTDDLPQVAQFLATNQQLAFPQQALIDHAKNAIIKRFDSQLDVSVDRTSLSDMISAVGAHYRKTRECEPHRVLSSLPLPVFITTNFSNLMADALTEVGKRPMVEFCRWKDDLLDYPSIYDDEPGYMPSPDQPMVFHLFGRLNIPDSLVLTEDNYFDFLIGATRNRDLIPASVRRALTDKGLLILGYRLDDWNFRVLFRSFLSLEGGARRNLYTNVAAQIDPEENQILEPERAREYLESYFFDNARLNIFWGSSMDFTTELIKRL